MARSPRQAMYWTVKYVSVNFRRLKTSIVCSLTIVDLQINDTKSFEKAPNNWKFKSALQITNVSKKKSRSTLSNILN